MTQVLESDYQIRPRLVIGGAILGGNEEIAYAYSLDDFRLECKRQRVDSDDVSRLFVALSHEIALAMRQAATNEARAGILRYNTHDQLGRKEQFMRGAV